MLHVETTELVHAVSDPFSSRKRSVLHSRSVPLQGQPRPTHREGLRRRGRRSCSCAGVVDLGWGTVGGPWYRSGFPIFWGTLNLLSDTLLKSKVYAVGNVFSLICEAARLPGGLVED